MKDGLRFVDCDMHIQEPGDLFERYLDPAFKSRVTTVVSANGELRRGGWIIDGLPTSMDVDLQQYRKRSSAGALGAPILGSATGQLSASRSAATGRLGFAIERDYDSEAQVMALEMEGVDIAVLFPTGGLALLARDDMDPLLSLALCEAYNNWIHEFCQRSPDQLKFAAMLPMHDVNLACQELLRCVRELGAVGSFIRPNLVNGHFWHSNYWDPLYTMHEDLDVTWGFHEGTGAWYSHMNTLYGENRFYRHVASHWIEMQQSLIAQIIGGVYEFHPKLRVGFLEAQNSWATRSAEPHRVGLCQLPRLPRAVPDADAQGVLPAKLLGRRRGQRAGDRVHRPAHRRRPDVHLHGLSPLRLQLPQCLQQPAGKCAQGDGGADPLRGSEALRFHRGRLPEGGRRGCRTRGRGRARRQIGPPDGESLLPRGPVREQANDDSALRGTGAKGGVDGAGCSARLRDEARCASG